MCACAGAWRSEGDYVFPSNFTPYVWSQGLLMNPWLTYWRDWVSSELQTSECLSPRKARVTDVCHSPLLGAGYPNPGLHASAVGTLLTAISLVCFQKVDLCVPWCLWKAQRTTYESCCSPSITIILILWRVSALPAFMHEAAEVRSVWIPWT